MAVTFTMKAAREMQGRIEHLLRSSQGMWVGTFMVWLTVYSRLIGVTQGLKKTFDHGQ